MADMFLAAPGGYNPRALSPRRVMTNMLLMATFELSNPIRVFIKVKSHNFARLTFRLRLRRHSKIIREIERYSLREFCAIN